MVKALFGGAKPAPRVDPEAERRRAEAEAAAKREQDEIKRKQEEEEEAQRRGLRGRRALLSAEGELGFPSTLGG